MHTQEALRQARQTEEQRRRDWNYRYNFGENANAQEQADENHRRELYRSNYLAPSHNGEQHLANPSHRNDHDSHVLLVSQPQVPHRYRHRADSVPGGPPLIPSIPTASMSTSSMARPQSRSWNGTSALDPTARLVVHNPGTAQQQQH